MTLPPGITSQINSWTSCQQQINKVNDDYSGMIHMLMSQIAIYEAWVKGGKQGPPQGIDPAHALWLFQTEAMPSATQSCEYNAQLQSDALNISNSVRNVITGSQNAFNSWLQGKEAGQTNQINDITDMMSGLNELHRILKLNHMKSILGSGVLSNINMMVSSTASAMGPGGVTAKNANMSKLYMSAVSGGQPVPAYFNQMSTNFNNLNQSVSGISSSIQTQMQYLQQSLQQYFSVYKNFFDDYSNLSAYILNKTTGS